MKLISLKIEAAERDADLIDMTFFSVFDLVPGDKSFRPTILVSPFDGTADRLRNNINKIFGNLFDLECRIKGDDLREWRFELVYFLDATAKYPDRLVRVTKSPIAEVPKPDGVGIIDYLSPTYTFEYTLDIELPVAGRMWGKAESVADQEDLLLPTHEYSGHSSPARVSLLFKDLKPNTLMIVDSELDLSPVAGQGFLTAIKQLGECEKYHLLLLTKSPMIIADVDRESVFVISTDPAGAAIATNPDFQTFGCDPTIILAKIFGIGPMSGRAAAKMLELMRSEDPAKILQSMPLFGDSVEKAYLFDRYRQLLAPEN
jgi:hypothetical protein